MIQLVQKFVTAHKYYPDKEEFKDHFFSHPDFPSLYAVTDTMDFFGIENLAAKVTDEQFSELPNQFLTLTNGDKQDQFIYVTSHNDDVISYLDEENVKHTLPLSDFLNSWTQVVIVIDENENSVLEKTQKSNTNVIWIFALLFLFTLYNQYTLQANYNVYLYAFFAFLGLGLSVFLLQEGFGINKEMTSKICKIGQSDSNGCQSVLNSSGAKIYKDFTLSDVCFVFFSALVLMLMIPQKNHFYYVAISLFSFPIIIFSLYYQYKVVKKWCALCLGISTSLIGIAIVTIVSFERFEVNATIKDTLVFFSILLLLTTIWNLLKPIITGYFELKKENRVQKRFKRNATTFNALLNNTPKINLLTLEPLNTIVIGNKDAQNEMLLFLSPSCGHCHTAFKDAMTLLEKYPEYLKLKIGFNINLENENNPYSKVVTTIVEQNGLFDNAKELLAKWHIERMELEAFNSTYQVSITEETKNTVTSQFNWCTENGFNYAPVKIFNKKLMPNEYTINDLNFFVKELE